MLCMLASVGTPPLWMHPLLLLTPPVPVVVYRLPTSRCLALMVSQARLHLAWQYGACTHASCFRVLVRAQWAHWCCWPFEGGDCQWLSLPSGLPSPCTVNTCTSMATWAVFGNTNTCKVLLVTCLAPVRPPSGMFQAFLQLCTRRICWMRNTLKAVHLPDHGKLISGKTAP